MAGNNDKPPEFIGASAKLAAAERMRQAAHEEAEYNASGKAVGQAIPVTIVFVMAVLLAMLPVGDIFVTADWSLTGIDSVDQLLFGAEIQKFTGDADLDRLIAILVRGSALFLLTGVAPFFASVAARIFGKNRLNPFVACWGAFVALPLLYFLWNGF